MTNVAGKRTVQKGSVMILRGTRTPSSMPLAVMGYWKEWKLMGDADSHRLDENLRGAGWNFFFLAGSIRGWSSGRGQASIRRAMQSVLEKVKTSEFNCVEVAEIRNRSFLGIPFTTVQAFTRHIQRSNQIDTLQQRHRKIKEAAFSQA
jgi:hypothetical protein